MSSSMLIVLSMMVAWSLVYGEFGLGQALLGLVFGTVFATVTRAGRAPVVAVRELPRRAFYLAVYLLVLIPFDILRSNLDMARRMLRPRPAIRPGIVRVRLGTMREATSALVSHAISMTPGEMVVDYSEDGQTIYVHLIDVSGAEVGEAAIWQLYRRVLQRVFE